MTQMLNSNCHTGLNLRVTQHLPRSATKLITLETVRSLINQEGKSPRGSLRENGGPIGKCSSHVAEINCKYKLVYLQNT